MVFNQLLIFIKFFVMISHNLLTRIEIIVEVHDSDRNYWWIRVNEKLIKVAGTVLKGARS